MTGRAATPRNAQSAPFPPAPRPHFPLEDKLTHVHGPNCHHDHGHAHGHSHSPYVAPPKVGRNDPCPCGSGKKHKACCLNQPAAAESAQG